MRRRVALRPSTTIEIGIATANPTNKNTELCRRAPNSSAAAATVSNTASAILGCGNPPGFR